MLIGKGGSSQVWHPPRKDRVIEKKYRGNTNFVQRLTNEDLTEILHGQHARSVFDPTNRMSNPLVALYNRPKKKYSEIRPYRNDDLNRFLAANRDHNNLGLFCKTAANLHGIMKGLTILHQYGWIHHDIKLDNILYNQDPWRLYLIDWSMSVPFAQVYHDSFRCWFSANHPSNPPEYKSYAAHKHGYKLIDNDFATDYAQNILVFTLLKIQPRYMEMLNAAHDKIKHRFDRKGFLKRIAPKVDVFGLGVVLAQCYLVMAYAMLYDKPVHKKLIRLIRGMTHPDPTRRWTMRHAALSFTPIVRSLCAASAA